MIIDGLDLDTDDLDEEGLFEVGSELLESLHLDEAEAIGGELIRRCYTGGFEIKARALGARGAYEEAVAVLRKGLEKAPELSLLWHLLGNYQGELGEYDACRASYKRALSLPRCDADSIRLDWATTELNEGRIEEARKLVSAVTDPEAADEVGLFELRAALQEDAHAQARELGLALLAPDRVLDPDMIAVVAATTGIACLRLGNTDEARSLAREACQRDSSDDSVQYLIRELHGRMAEREPGLYHVMVDFAEPSGEESEGYYQRFTVVAESADEATELARAYAEWSGRTGYSVEPAEYIEANSASLAGVYWEGPREYYDDETE